MTQRICSRMMATRRRASRGRAWPVVLLALGLAGPAGMGVAPARAAQPEDTTAARGRLRDAVRQHALHTLDGRTLTPSSLRGQVVVVHLWASWCRPCRRELPWLDALNTEIGSQGGRVLAVSIDQDPENVRRFVREHGLKLQVFHDGPAGLASRIDLDHVPYTVVLDRNGEVAFTTSGSDEDALAELGALTRRLVATRPPLSSSVEGIAP